MADFEYYDQERLWWQQQERLAKSKLNEKVESSSASDSDSTPIISRVTTQKLDEYAKGTSLEPLDEWGLESLDTKMTGYINMS